MPLKIQHSDNDGNDITTAIVLSIPVHDPACSVMPYQCMMQLHDGTTITKTLLVMDKIANSPINKTKAPPTPSFPLINVLPAWLQHGSKVTPDKDGEFHKGYIMPARDGSARLLCLRHKSSKKESWGVNLPSLAAEWSSMVVNNIIQPTWNAISFI